ncbi:MAG: capsule assembly Wzi family protein [Marinifilaceae bacterium]|jgi:hypothetical protein|nr:capsule assembly Wzi family protein [Marinifilaceae bacterium]
MKKLLILCYLVYLSNIINAQEIKYSLGIDNSFSSEKKLPFWMVNNKYGVIRDQNNSMLSAGIFKERTDSIFDYSFGLDAFQQLYDNISTSSLINQYYVKLNHKKWHLLLGAKNPDLYYDGLSMSNDNIVMTGNARPYPKIEIGTSDYIPVPFTNNNVFVKGVFSNGWMLDNRAVEDVMVHHKNAYIRFGKKKGLSFEFGVEHYAQWGGKSAKYGKLDSGLSAFMKILVADSGDDQKIMNEYDNALGNHIGQNQLKVNYNTKKLQATFYMRNMFEDRSQDIGKLFRNHKDIQDINYGFYFKFKNQKIVKSVLAEFYSTMDQGNLGDDGPYYIGYDSNFNNGIYSSGWSNYKRGFGIPLNSPTSISADNSIHFKNTTFKAFNFGITGEYKEFKYLLKYTYHRNYGQVSNTVVGKPTNSTLKPKRIYSVDPAENQNYMLFNLQLPDFKLPFKIITSIAADFGDISENYGFGIKLVKTGVFDF